MVQSPVIIPRLGPSQVIEGTLEEITAYLERLNSDRNKRFTLIVPGEELTDEQPPHSGMTFAEILEPLQRDFEATGMTEEELGEFIDAQIEAHRAERRDKAQVSNA